MHHSTQRKEATAQKIQSVPGSINPGIHKIVSVANSSSLANLAFAN